MADRYWVGGSAVWDGNALTKWALTSGGTGGESEPTATDDVYFDTGSGNVTITVSGTRVAKSINCTGFIGTVAGTATPALNLSGNLTLVSGMVVTYTGTTTFLGNSTITSSGKTLGPVTVNAANSTVSLSDALVSSGTISLTAGTFTTNDFNLTGTILASTGSTLRTMNAGSSTITLSSTSPISFSSTNFTFNKGTSSILLTGTSVSLYAGEVPLHNVTFSSTTASTHIIGFTSNFYNGFPTLTVNDLTVTAPASTGRTTVVFGNDGSFVYTGASTRLILTGRLKSSGTAGNRRIIFASRHYGNLTDITCTGADLNDTDFQGIRIRGSGSFFSGTRLGDLGGNYGITFPTSKTVYWNNATGGNWSSNSWAASPGAGVSLDNFPLAQDTAVIQNTGLNTSATITLDGAITYTGSIDFSARTDACTFTLGANYNICGNWIMGSGVNVSNYAVMVFSGIGRTQYINTAGKAFSGPVYFHNISGTVEFQSAVQITGGGDSCQLISGTVKTNDYNLTVYTLRYSATEWKRFYGGNSTLTFSGVSGSITTPGTIEAYTANTNVVINLPSTSATLDLSGAEWGAFSPGTSFLTLNGNHTFNGNVNLVQSTTIGGNLTIRGNLICSAPSSTGANRYYFGNGLTITRGLFCSGANVTRRVSIESSTRGTRRTFSVGQLFANDCDFRDIEIVGAAAGTSPTRAGDAGNNLGISFPTSKNVYWNLGGNVTWSANAWALSSGGSVSIDNFPLPQDKIIFDDTGSAGNVTLETVYLGDLDFSARVSNPMGFTIASNSPGICGNLTLGNAVSLISSTGTLYFTGGRPQYISSNSKVIPFNIGTENSNAFVTLSGNLDMASNRTFSLISGNFFAGNSNVNIGAFNSNQSTTRTLRMGNAQWTLSGTGTIWETSTVTNFSPIIETANILLSDTSTSARTFNGGGLSYNNLIIGGSTGSSTLTINGNNFFREISSPKTVAHTIALGSTTQTFGKWSVTGTAGNVVTLTGTGTGHVIAGEATSGIDYLAMGSIGFSSTSPGEFFAGANSTGTATAPVFRTAIPTGNTLYWVGGTGNWSNANMWATVSGGTGGLTTPKSIDDVIFDTSSNATSYTATIDNLTRVKSFTLNGPAAGTVTLAGSGTLVHHGNVFYNTSNVSVTGNFGIILSGSKESTYAVTSSSISWQQTMQVHGSWAQWRLTRDIAFIGTFSLLSGSFDTNNYNVALNWANSNTYNPRWLYMNGSIFNFGGNIGGATIIDFTNSRNFFTAPGTSTILYSGSANGPLQFGGLVFYNFLSNNSGSNIDMYGQNTWLGNLSIQAGGATLRASNTMQNLVVNAPSSDGFRALPTFLANQTITGNLNISGTSAVRRTSLTSGLLPTQIVLTVNNSTAPLQDIDFQGIKIIGASAPLSGTRLGNRGNNSGIIFDTPKTSYWNLAGSQNWSAVGWANTSGGTPNVVNFPLAQDTAIIDNSSAGSGITFQSTWGVTNLDTSSRTSALTVTFTSSPTIMGNILTGSGITYAGSGTLNLTGNLTNFVSNGKTLATPITINSGSGNVILGDNLNTTGTITLTSGTLNANNYSVTSSNFSSTNSNERRIIMGNALWTLSGTGYLWDTGNPTNLTVDKGTANILVSNITTSDRYVSPGGVSLNKLTIGGVTGSSRFFFLSNGSFTEIASIKNAPFSILNGDSIFFVARPITKVGRLTVTGTTANTVSYYGVYNNGSNYFKNTFLFTGSGVVADISDSFFYFTNFFTVESGQIAYARRSTASLGGLSFQYQDNLVQTLGDKTGNFLILFP